MGEQACLGILQSMAIHVGPVVKELDGHGSVGDGTQCKAANSTLHISIAPVLAKGFAERFLLPFCAHHHYCPVLGQDEVWKASTGMTC